MTDAVAEARSTEAVRTVPDRALTVLFGAASFLGSGLLFAVQPMVARMLLPSLGGSAAVWNTAMVFFQAALLAGYALAHLSATKLSARQHLLGQLVGLAAVGALLPLAVPSGWRPPVGGNPMWWTLSVLAVMVGAPFLLLATTSPTLQRWLTTTGHRRAADPYFLYGASNAGSLLALVAYPLVLERVLSTSDQAWAWAVAYGLFVVLMAGCAMATWRHRVLGAAERTPASPTTKLGAAQPTRWIVLAAAPSALLLGVTRYLATDVASVPLLWVIPLALYLGTFIVAFGVRGGAIGPKAEFVLAVAVVPALFGWAGPLLLGASTGQLAVFACVLVAFTAAALALHARLAADRPTAEHLTTFYLCLSFGGVVGGAAAALVAPVVFDTILEFPVALVACVVLLPPAAGQDTRRAALTRTTVGLAGGLLLVLGGGAVRALGAVGVGVWSGLLFRRSPKGAGVLLAVAVAIVAIIGVPGTIHTERTFYGVSAVERDGDVHYLRSGTTVHGVQRRGGAAEDVPLAYYSRSGPVGQVIGARRAGGPLDIGVVGLGAGTLAAYGADGDRITFYEIDPAVVRIASDPSLFSFIDRSRADVDIELGDGRLLLERSERRHDVLVLDAFSSDAIPLHLLTREAFSVYRDHLSADGVLLIHVSSRHFGLAPEVVALAEDAGLLVVDERHAPEEELASASHWLAATADSDVLAAVERSGDWRTTEAADDVWTDEHADLLGTLNVG